MITTSIKIIYWLHFICRILYLFLPAYMYPPNRNDSSRGDE